MSDLVIFLDDGGVMNDNRLRGGQWQRLVADFFVPIFGGTASAWGEANGLVAERILDPAAWPKRLEESADCRSFDRAYQLDWLGGMCKLVGVTPPSEEESVVLAHRAYQYITPRGQAAFPGAAEAIRTLRSRRYLLHTASGESSIDLAGYLEGMGVHDCFDRLYGPDLIDTFKAGPEFYARLFEDAAIQPANAVVVDDSPEAVGWAASVGAMTVLVNAAREVESKATIVIGSLAELPAAIEQWENPESGSQR